MDELVSYTATRNVRSRAVMQRLGMRHDPADDFDHAHIHDRRLRRQVLYRLTASQWQETLEALSRSQQAGARAAARRPERQPDGARIEAAAPRAQSSTDVALAG